MGGAGNRPAYDAEENMQRIKTITVKLSAEEIESIVIGYLCSTGMLPGANTNNSSIDFILGRMDLAYDMTRPILSGCTVTSDMEESE